MRIGLPLTVCLAVLLAAAPAPTGLPAAGHPAPERPLSKATLHRILTGTEISIEYRETPAREVFKHLQTVLGISIRGRYLDDRAGHGIDPDTPITLLAIDTHAVHVLEEALDQCDDLDPCTWQLRRGYVEVGTKERLSVPAAMEIRYYPIRDLLMIAPSFDNAPDLDISAALNQASGGGGAGFGGGSTGGGGGSDSGGIISPPAEDPLRLQDAEFVQDLIDLIERTVEPESWEAGGGRATITYLTGTLIIRAPGFVHRRLTGGP